MPNVFRAYQPKVEFDYSVQYQVASPLVGVQNKVIVNPTLNHRKVWCIIETTGTTYLKRWDLVATLNGREIYRQPIARYSSAGGQDLSWISGYNGTAGNVGIGNEQIRVNVASTTPYVLSAWRLNLTADLFYLDCLNGVTSNASIDAYLFVQSQAGI